MQHYYNCRVAPLEQQWASFSIQYPAPQPPTAFPSWLPTFYDALLLLIDHEVCCQLAATKVNALDLNRDHG